MQNSANFFRKNQEKNCTKIFDSSNFTDHTVWDLKKEQCMSVLEVSDLKWRFCISQFPKHHPDRYGLSSSIPQHMIPVVTPTSVHASPDHAAPFFSLCEQKFFAELGCKLHQEIYQAGKQPRGKIFSWTGFPIPFFEVLHNTTAVRNKELQGRSRQVILLQNV